MPRRDSGKGDLRSRILRPAVLRGADRSIVGVAIVVGPVVVIKRRDREQQARLKRMDPGETGERIPLPLHVPNPCRLRVLVVWNLVIVAPERGDETELIVRVAVIDQ